MQIKFALVSGQHTIPKRIIQSSTNYKEAILPKLGIFRARNEFTCLSNHPQPCQRNSKWGGLELRQQRSKIFGEDLVFNFIPLKKVRHWAEDAII